MLAIEMLAMRNAFSTLKLVIGFCGSEFSMGRYLAQSWWICHCVPWVELVMTPSYKKNEIVGELKLVSKNNSSRVFPHPLDVSPK